MQNLAGGFPTNFCCQPEKIDSKIRDSLRTRMETTDEQPLVDPTTEENHIRNELYKVVIPITNIPCELEVPQAPRAKEPSPKNTFSYRLNERVKLRPTNIHKLFTQKNDKSFINYTQVMKIKDILNREERRNRLRKLRRIIKKVKDHWNKVKIIKNFSSLLQKINVG